MPSPNIRIVNKPIADLVPADYNPRQLTEVQFAQIKASIDEFGFVDPVIVNTNPERFNIIVGGHQRVKVAQAIGYTEVPCVEVNISIEKEKELNIRLNKATGEWDWEALANNFDNADLIAWGFTPEELDIAHSTVEETTGDDDVNNPIGNPVTVLGDLYEIKTATATLRILCGDCRDMNLVTRLMDGKSAQFCFTDPPWNVAYGANMEEGNAMGYRPRTIQNDSMTQEEFLQFMRDSFTSIASVMDEGGMIYVAMSAQEWGTIMQAMKECGFHWSSTIIWNKDRLVMSRKDYHTKYEPLYYGWKDGAPRLAPLEDRQQSDVWDIERPSRSDIHPTMKPVALVVRALENSSKRGNNVVDFFNGSGTTGVACLKAGRNYFAFDIDPLYTDGAIGRLLEFCGANGMEYTATRNGTPFTLADIRRE